MKDFISKGTGNSRFLKSSISSTTTWEQFRDLLRGGTAPIDLNGINPLGVTEAGTPLNKSSLLTDSTSLLMGLSEDAVVNDALFSLCVGTGKYAFIVKVVYSNGLPASGITLTGVTDLNGATAITDSKGEVICSGASQQTTITVTGDNFVDWVQNVYSVSVTGQKGEVTPVSLTIMLKTTQEMVFSTSGTFKFSKAVDTADFSAVGGGGGGQNGTLANKSGNGGSGGYASTVLNIPVVPLEVYTGYVGSGGSGGLFNSTSYNTKNSGANGGSSGITKGSTIVSASGGVGATGNTVVSGNGNGGIEGTPATSGTQKLFTTGQLVGGGGGFGCFYGSTGNSGGSPYGGSGGYYINNYSDCGAGGNGTGYGGGGGGGGGGVAIGSQYKGGNGGNGANGCFAVRWRYKTV